MWIMRIVNGKLGFLCSCMCSLCFYFCCIFLEETLHDFNVSLMVFSTQLSVWPMTHARSLCGHSLCRGQKPAAGYWPTFTAEAISAFPLSFSSPYTTATQWLHLLDLWARFSGRVTMSKSSNQANIKPHLTSGLLFKVRKGCDWHPLMDTNW